MSTTVSKFTSSEPKMSILQNEAIVQKKYAKVYNVSYS